MKDSRALPSLLLAIAAVVACAIVGWRATSTEPRSLATDSQPAAGETGQRIQGSHGEPARPGVSAATGTDPAPDERTAAEPPRDGDALDAQDGPTLRVTLVGLQPAAPWTAPLRLDLDGRDEAADRRLDHDATATVEAQGHATFALPAWWRTATTVQGRITAHDDHYLEVDHRFAGPPAHDEIAVDVQVVGVLEGRVVDSRGAGVAAARVRVFPMRDGKPLDENVGENNTRDDGSFWLQVPPAVPLLLLAAPMHRAIGARAHTLGDGAVADDGSLRTDLLPATIACRGGPGGSTRVPDLVLGDAAPLHGAVRWSDGGPVPLATVRALPQRGTTLRLGTDAGVELRDDGRAVPLGITTTDDAGRFTLPTVPGLATDVALQRLPEARLLGDLRVVDVLPPQNVELHVPHAATLRVVDAGKPVAHAWIEVEGAAPWQVDAAGSTAVSVVGTARVRGRHEQRQSAWIDLGAATAGTRIDLELADALGSVSIEFEGDFRVRNTMVEWRAADGRTGREHLLRDDRGGPFRLFLEPGVHHLRIGPGGGERNGVYLLPVERDVEVRAGGTERLTVPAAFGGSFIVFATDSNGVHVAGRCVVRSATGEDLTDCFRIDEDGAGTRRGSAGELLGGAPNTFTRVLPPGDYELELSFVDHGTFRRRLTIRPRTMTDVRVRL